MALAIHEAEVETVEVEGEKEEDEVIAVDIVIVVRITVVVKVSVEALIAVGIVDEYALTMHFGHVAFIVESSQLLLLVLLVVGTLRVTGLVGPGASTCCCRAVTSARQLAINTVVCSTQVIHGFNSVVYFNIAGDIFRHLWQYHWGSLVSTPCKTSLTATLIFAHFAWKCFVHPKQVITSKEAIVGRARL